MAEAEQTTLTLERPVERSGRVSLGSIAAAVALLLMIALAIGIAWSGPDPDSADAHDWLPGAREFLDHLYGGLTLQVLLGMAVLGLVLEKLIPARPQDMSNSLLNIPYSALVLVFVGAIFPLQLLFAETVTGYLGARNIFDLTIDTHGSILLVVTAMLIEALVVDFFFYWFHRCQHRTNVLWQVHMLHHSDMALNVTTTHRVHFLEHLLTPLFMVLPIMLLFELPDRDIYWIALAPTVWSYVVHANVRVGFGRFWWLLSSPQYHRIHHSILPEHRDKNFAVWFPIYDVMFGTAHRPKRDEFPETGVAGVEVATLSDAFMLPFERWWAMAKGSVRR